MYVVRLDMLGMIGWAGIGPRGEWFVASKEEHATRFASLEEAVQLRNVIARDAIGMRFPPFVEEVTP